MKPNVVWDLENLPLPFETDSFDEIHAYHILEHTGRQGDFKFFFSQWEDFWRILKPGGFFVALVPAWNQEGAWIDPGHRRIITPGTLLFLDQKEYERRVGTTLMTDYRLYYKGNFRRIESGFSTDEQDFWFVLRAMK